jgi:hypothetical protein
MANARLTLGLFVAVLCGIVATPARGGSAIRRSVNARVRVISLPSDSARFDLPGEWIRAGSVHATLDGVPLQPGADYELEMTEGILRLLRPLPAGHLTVRYEVLPLAIGRIFQAPIPPDTGSVARAPIPPRPAGEATVASRAHLDIRGSKTVSLEIGNTQDLTVRQSLDVSLSGEIVEGVRVRGVLSDRQTPLQAEGRTTDLSDLDRVFLEVEGPGAGMTLGDFVLRGPAGLFTRYERQLEGIRLTGRAGEGSASVAAATIPGVFRSIEFLGVEGKQGPYSLRPPEATADAAVVAGTERVWLDGELLVRGEDRDYLIDYAASTVTFTGRRVVNQASRITVDCQIGTQPYRRNAYAAEAGWGAAAKPEGHGFGLRASVLAERDDRGHPIGGALTAREKEILSAAGDSLSDSLNAGVDCGAIGHGDYEQVEADSLVLPFFRFVGDSSGTCKVRFDDVGVGRGDYLDSLAAGGKTIYRFVGPRRGRFAPGRAVPRPSERSLVDLLGFWAGPGGLTFEMEGAGSSDDPNTYSDRDDADKTGGALRLRFARETAPVRALGRGLGRWGVELESRDVEPRFRAIGRVDPGWLGYDWGVASDRFGNGDRRRSIRARQEPGAGLSLEEAYESLSNRRDLEGDRKSLRLQRTGRVFGNAEVQRVATRDRGSGATIRGARRVGMAAAGVRWMRMESSFGLRREESEIGTGSARTGSGFDEWRGSGAWILTRERGRFDLTRTVRQDKRIDASSRANRGRAGTWDARAVYQPVGRLLDLRYTRRDFTLSGSTTRSDLAGLLWSQEESSGRFSQQLRADLTTQDQASRTKSIEYVGPGLGNYDSLGVYVGSGDYDVVLRPSGDRRLERRLDGSWRIEFAPGRGREATPQGLASSALWSSQWLLYATTTVRTAGSAGEFWDDLPSLLAARKAGVPLASYRLRMEASALPQARWAGPQVRVERERSRSNDLSNVQSDRERDLAQLTLRSTPTRAWTLEQEVQGDRDVERTRFTSGAAAGASGWRSARIRFGGWFRPREGWTTRLGLIGRRRTRVETGGHYEVTQLVPGFQWVGPKRTRVDLQATRSWVSGPGGQPLGLERGGWEGRGSLALRLHTYLDATAIWEIKAPDTGARQTTARAEVRSVF